MYQADSQPLLLHPCIIQGGRVIIRLPHKDLEITVPGTVAKALVRLVDGTRPLSQIVSQFERRWNRKSIRHLFKTLFDQGVLIDGRDISSVLWKFVENPSPWHYDLDDVEIERMVLDDSLQQEAGMVTYRLSIRGELSPLALRASDRRFGNVAVAKQKIARILWAGYGLLRTRFALSSSEVRRRTVPSAGGLYPLLIHLVLLKRSGDMDPGVYRVVMNQAHSVSLHRLEGSLDLARSVFVDRSTARYATGFIVISGAFSRSTRKYGNRGILYTLLEAGHSAQNILQAAQTEKIGACEVGGFFESRLHELLQISSGVEPLTTIVFGSIETDAEKSRPVPIGDSIVAGCETVPRRIGNFQLPFTMVFAEVNSGGEPSWSCGRARNPRLATTKAVVEAMEWSACGRIPYGELRTASYKELSEQAVDPRTMARYLPGQFNRQTGLVPFKPERASSWSAFTDMETGATKYVLADFVYFPYTPRVGMRYAYANSSGCAAHATQEKATENAALELIEREAFMVTWLNRAKPRVIKRTTLSESIQRRMRALIAEGFVTTIVDITLDTTPVPLVVTYNKQLSFFTCAAASSFQIEQAIGKA